MTLTLVVEDGTVVAGANTYLTEADANTILEDYGYVLTPATADVNLVTSSRYLNRFRGRYKGSLVDASQPLQWPRQGVYIDCNLLASDEIPDEIKIAQALGAYYESINQPLQVVSNGATLTQRSISGVGSFSYADNGQNSKQMQFPDIDDQLNVLFDRLQVFRA